MKTTLVAAIALALTCTLYPYPYLLMALLAALSAVFLFLHKKTAYWYVFGIAAVAGPVAEAIAIHFGVWSYAFPKFVGVPVWLPMVWGLTGVIVVRISNRVERIAP